METSRQAGQIRREGNLIKRQARFEKYRPGGQFAMNVPKQVLKGYRLSVAFLMSGDIATDHLDHVVQQQAEPELKDRRLRRASDQTLQMKDFRDLLEDLLDSPALQVMIQQILGGITLGIQKVSDNYNVRFAGPLQCDLSDIAALGMIGRSHPAPFLKECSASGIGSRLPGRCESGWKPTLGWRRIRK